MLKLLFWSLLFANGALFAYHQGYLDPLFPDGRESARMARQLHVDQIKLIPASAATLPAPRAAPEVLACREISNIKPAQAKQLETQLNALVPNGKLTQYKIPTPPRYMIFIPPQVNKADADRKAGELRRLGIADFYVIPEGELKWAISLGIFSTEEAARTQLATMVQRGARNARLHTYHSTATDKIVFQLRELDENTARAVTQLLSDFPGMEIRHCSAP